MTQTQLIFYFLSGFLGLFLGWLLYRTKQAVLQERLMNLAREKAGQDTLLNQNQSLIEELRKSLSDLQTNLTESEIRGQEEKKSAEEKIVLLNEAHQKLSDSFKILSAEALKSNNQSFLQIAKMEFEKLQMGSKNDLESRQKAIGELIQPLKQSLEKVDKQIQEMEKTRTAAYSGLTEQVRSLASTQIQLQKETSNLVQALRTPVVRGRWGEIQLKKVVEMAGMVNYCDFREQQTTQTEEGMLRPDLSVYLPGNKTIVVDSKVPLQAYLEALEAKDEDSKSVKLSEHARQLKDHITRLGLKSYWDQFKGNSPEFVVLFIPGEIFFSAALQQDPELIEYGVTKRVIVATPTTLIALLKAIAYGWSQEQITKNTREISLLGKDLFERLQVLSDYFTDLKRGLEKAVESYNKAVGSFETRVMVSARKFKELGVTSEKDIPSLEPVDKSIRSLDAEA
ncbi:MAG: DNA recombination protein RmuC [Candidatus Aureabacteria bacterium]|nr:DNA recombination protein RmuC [Candidatus Auribacterota bacterium]